MRKLLESSNPGVRAGGAAAAAGLAPFIAKVNNTSFMKPELLAAWGIMGPVARMLREGNPLEQVAAAGVVDILCSTADIEHDIDLPALVGPLVVALRGGTPAAKEAALQALCGLATEGGREAGTLMMGERVIGPLVRMIEEGKSEDIKGTAILALREMISPSNCGDGHARMCEELREEGAIDALLLRMMEDPDRAFGAVDLWEDLAWHFDLEGMEDMGMLRPVIALLGGEDSFTAAEVARMIWSFAEFEDIRAKLVAAGVLEPLTKLLKDGNLRAKIMSAHALYRFALDASNKVNFPLRLFLGCLLVANRQETSPE